MQGFGAVDLLFRATRGNQNEQFQLDSSNNVSLLTRTEDFLFDRMAATHYTRDGRNHPLRVLLEQHQQRSARFRKLVVVQRE